MCVSLWLLLGKCPFMSLGKFTCYPSTSAAASCNTLEMASCGKGWRERWGRGKLVENCVGCHFSACSVGSLALDSSLIYDIVLSFNAIGILRRVLGKIKFKVEFKK